MQKIELSNAEDIKQYQKAKKAQIWETFNKAGENPREATLITKAELDEQYPDESFERYSIGSLSKFRQDLVKAEGVQDKDAAFKEATKGLLPFVVQDGQKKAIVFVRKKEEGE